MSDVESAAWALVHDYPGGAPALGPKAGIDGQLLSNKVNPNNDRNRLMLKEAVRIQIASGDHRILYAEADELGYVVLPKPRIVAGDITHALANMCAEFGDYLRVVNESIDDNRITPNELVKLERELAEMMAAATHLQSLLATKSGR